MGDAAAVPDPPLYAPSQSSLYSFEKPECGAGRAECHHGDPIRFRSSSSTQGVFRPRHAVPGGRPPKLGLFRRLVVFRSSTAPNRDNSRSDTSPIRQGGCDPSLLATGNSRVRRLGQSNDGDLEPENSAGRSPDWSGQHSPIPASTSKSSNGPDAGRWRRAGLLSSKESARRIRLCVSDH